MPPAREQQAALANPLKIACVPRSITPFVVVMGKRMVTHATQNAQALETGLKVLVEINESYAEGFVLLS